MPIYEYQCQACDHRFDKIQKMSDPTPSACPECQKDQLKRLVSAPSFRLTGSGWYETDFKNKGKEKPKEKQPSKTDTKTTDSTKKDTPSKKEKPTTKKT